MTTNKDFKRLVRGRMQKTGESYTAARAQLLKLKSHATPSAACFAKLAGLSDAAVKAKTGCTWERWVSALDRVEAQTWPHRRIARYVQEKYRVRDWWAQMVTVGYERIKGLRVIGQRRGGGFEATKSKTFPVPLARLYRAFRDERARRRWLPDVTLEVRTAKANRSMRLTWPDQTLVAVGFSGKGPAKSQVQVQHSKLPDRASGSQMKQYWAERLATLEEVLDQTR
ncbi:MAG TPA: hypothetical protein VEU74_08795 [Gemmatimonadales bacterium]|nr:hypothetical protein [Gemmatimonadales bacterium]